MSEKVYAWLLKLYPVHFRRDYGPAAMQLFRDRLRAERGAFRRIRLWLDLITDLAISIPAEHWRGAPAEPAVEGALRISEEAIAAMTRRIAILPAVFACFFVLLGLSMGWWGNSSHLLLFASYILLALIIGRRFCSVGRFRERWRNYQVILESDRIQQKQNGRNLTLLSSEIVKVNEDQYGLTIVGLREGSPAGAAENLDPRQTRERLLSIWIPAGITGYQRAKEHIFQWTDRVSQRRALWFTSRPPFMYVVCLIPAMLLIRSVQWFLVITAVYYGMVLLAIMMHVCRPPRDSGLTPRARGLNLPGPHYMWRRFRNSCRNPAVSILVFLPVLKAVALAMS